MGKTTVVGFVESAHILTRLLVGLVNGDALCHYLQGVQHEGNSIQQVRSPCLLFDIGVKFFLMTFWNYIPSFCVTSVTVV